MDDKPRYLTFQLVLQLVSLNNSHAFVVRLRDASIAGLFKNSEMYFVALKKPFNLTEGKKKTLTRLSSSISHEA